MPDDRLNPYASPQSLEATDAAGRTAALVYLRPYQSARGKAKWAIGTCIVALVMQIALLGSSALQLAMLYPAQQVGGIDDATANSNDTRQMAIAVATRVAEIAALIALLFWVYATHANLPALGNSHLEFSSGWAVGWFFVPLANLYKPHQVVSEIWRGSDPAVWRAESPSGTRLVGWWWCWRVFSAIAERIMNAFERETKSLEGFLGLTWLLIGLIVVLDIPTLILQILVVRKIQAFQEERHPIAVNQPTTGDFRDPLATFPS
jgi:hypothetical protein